MQGDGESVTVALPLCTWSLVPSILMQGDGVGGETGGRGAFGADAEEDDAGGGS